MSNILTIGFCTEGPTDKRFLSAVIKKTFESIAFECDSMIDVFDPVYVHFEKEQGFILGVEKAAEFASSIGMLVLCVHTDADDKNDSKAFNERIKPAFENVSNKNNKGTYSNLVAIVPVTMTESWILADTDILKSEIGTEETDANLGIHKKPEQINDPKSVIIEAIRIAHEKLPRRRKKIEISEIYQPLGQAISIVKLQKLDSFQKFESAVRDAFKGLNFLN